jgi:hypothetical protein
MKNSKYSTFIQLGDILFTMEIIKGSWIGAG